MDKKSLEKVSEVYPIQVKPYQLYMTDAENPTVVEKVNAMIQNLHHMGRLTNNVVLQWNEVMKWVVDGGIEEITTDILLEKLDVALNTDLRVLTETVADEKIGELVASGQFEEKIGTAIGIMHENIQGSLNGFSAQLAEKADVSQLESLAGGTPKLVVQTVANLPASVAEGGEKLALVLADGHKYYWNGTSWISAGVYQAVEIANESVTARKIQKKTLTPTQTEFLTVGTNKFNRASIHNVAGGFLTQEGKVANHASFGYTHPIPVGSSNVIRGRHDKDFGPTTVLTSFKGIVYDNHGNPLYNLGQTDKMPTVPIIVTNGYFECTLPVDSAIDHVRINYAVSAVSTTMVTVNEAYPTTFAPYEIDLLNKNSNMQNEINSIKTGYGLLPNSVTPEKASFINFTANKFDKNSTGNVLGSFIRSTGVPYAQADTAYSHKINVASGSVVRLTHLPIYGITSSNTAFQGYLYDANDVPIFNIGIDATKPSTGVTQVGNYMEFTAPNDSRIAYMRINYLQSSKNAFMVSVNQAYPTEYVGYGLVLDGLTYQDERVDALGDEVKALDYEEYKHIFNDALCIGDSLTEGVYYGDGNIRAISENYPHYLSKLTNWTVENSGVGGYSASEWYLNKSDQYTYSNYDVVIICLGTNDGLTDTLAADTASKPYANTDTGAYCSLIEKIQAANPNAKIFMTNNFASTALTTTNKVIGQIAAKYSLPLININDGTLFGAGTEILHPNNAVHFGKIGNLTFAKHILKAICEKVATNLSAYNTPRD